MSASEIFISDVINDGGTEKCDNNVFYNHIFKDLDLIVFGGINNESKIHNLLNQNNIKAVGIGNCLNYSENSYQFFKDKLNYSFIR